MAEKIFKREDGGKIRITVALTTYTTDIAWIVQIQICEPGKRKFHGIIDEDSWEYRRLSMKERKEYSMRAALALVSIEEINEVKKIELDRLFSLEHNYRIY